MTKIAQHDEIHKQLHNMMKSTNNCTTQWHLQTIAQHVEIHKQLRHMVKFTSIHAQNKIELESGRQRGSNHVTDSREEDCSSNTM